MSSPISLVDFNTVSGEDRASRRLSKIVATLGPACDIPGRVSELLEAGVDVFRINLSHGEHEEHARRVRHVREVSQGMRRNPGILMDLQGPRIRLGVFHGGEALIRTASRVVMTVDAVSGTSQLLPVSWTDLVKVVRPGERILLADGAVEMRAVRRDDSILQCEVTSGGSVRDHQGINLPDSDLQFPALTPRDENDLEFGIELGIDFVALSFVRTADDVEHLREYLRKRGQTTPIVAKIEKMEACRLLTEIANAADGLMVARGDLGVEIGLPAVPAMQRRIIRGAVDRGRFVITATQMFESMVQRAAPTRAEVSDVANAVREGSDALMLSAETAMGNFPVEAVRIMSEVAVETERCMHRQPDRMPESTRSVDETIAACACMAARSAGAAAVVVSSATGATAQRISHYRPGAPVYAIVPESSIARRLAIVYGIFPLVAPHIRSAGELERHVSIYMVDSGLVSKGDVIVIVVGEPVGQKGTTNTVRLFRAGTRHDCEAWPRPSAIGPIEKRQ